MGITLSYRIAPTMLRSGGLYANMFMFWAAPTDFMHGVNLRPIVNPSFIRSIRRGRETMLGRGGGIYSFVAKIGVGMNQVYSHPKNSKSGKTQLHSAG